MLQTKPMPHRGQMVTGWSLDGGVLTIRTLRHSEKEHVAGALRLTPIRDDIIQVEMTEGNPPPQRPSRSVIQREIESAFAVTESKTTLTAATTAVRIEISKSHCALRYCDSEGRLLLAEPEEGGKRLTPIEIEKTVYDEAAKQVVDQSVDGMKLRVEGASRVVDRQGYRVAMDFALQEDEAVYGLGQHEEGILNYRGRHQFLYQQNMKVAMPVLVSTKGYGLFWDTLALSIFDDTGDHATVTVDAADRLCYYFVHGPEFDRIVAGMRHLTGPLPMLPKWAYGYLQSRERYETADELESIVKEYRRRNVPLDCVILDWRSWEGELWGQKTFDRERFPDPAAMMNRLHELHARMMISIWPNMAEGGENHAEMKTAGHLLGNQSTYDAYDAEARAMYWRHANDGLFKHGVDAWWCDCTEPFEADWKGSHKPDPFTRLRINCEEAKKYLDPAEINGYSLAHSQGLYEGQRSVTDEKRVVNLTRSASVGQHRYDTITWSGDIEARWSRMRKQIADGLNFTVTGNPRWTLDIGAFFAKPGVQWFWDGQYPEGNTDSGYRELYTRWLELGVFLPVFRSHGTDTEREIWHFGEPGTPFYDAIKKNIELRYRLMPYIYSLAGWEAHRGYTSFRNLAFDFRHDPQVYDIADQFMFGPSLMVCPVLEPQHYGPNGRELTGAPQSRRVYLPAGRCWYDFHTHQRYDGGQWIDVATPLDRIPVFVPGGSILPMGPVMQHANEQPGAPWEILVFPGRDARFDLYEDEGDGYGYEAGAFAWRTIEWNDQAVEVNIHDPEGGFPGFVADRNLDVSVIPLSR